MNGYGTPISPPGWHDDPQNPSQLRYWDGAQWTEHTVRRYSNAPPRGAVETQPRSGVPWWAWVIIAAAVVVVGPLVVVAFAQIAGSTAPTQSQPIAPVESFVPSETEVQEFGDFGPGIYLVGEDIEPGTYLSRPPEASQSGAVSCFWKITHNSAKSRGISVTVHLVEGGSALVTVADGDSLDVQRCGRWERVEPSTLFENDDAKPLFHDGTWIVGEDIAPGTYLTDDERDVEIRRESCFWTITENYENNLLDPVERDSTMQGKSTLTVESGQQLSTLGCGTWSLVRTHQEGQRIVQDPQETKEQ